MSAGMPANVLQPCVSFLLMSTRILEQPCAKNYARLLLVVVRHTKFFSKCLPVECLSRFKGRGNFLGFCCALAVLTAFRSIHTGGVEIYKLILRTIKSFMPIKRKQNVLVNVRLLVLKLHLTLSALFLALLATLYANCALQ